MKIKNQKSMEDTERRNGLLKNELILIEIQKVSRNGFLQSKYKYWSP